MMAHLCQLLGHSTVHSASLHTYHDREEHFEIEVSVKDAEEYKQCYLCGSVHRDPPIGDVSEILIVWLVFVGDEEEFEPLQELDPIQGGHTQVEDQAIQHGKWEELQHAVRHDRDANENGHEE